MICQRGPECGMVSTEKEMRFKNTDLPLTTEKQIHELQDGQESNPQGSISVVVARGEYFSEILSVQYFLVIPSDCWMSKI
jgi:hypothetical protein